MKTIAIFILAFSLNTVFLQNINAANYTWTGTTSTAWNNTGNWNPSGIPDSTDNVTIVSTTNQPILDQNRKVNNLTMTSGTVDLNGYELLIKGTGTFTSGTITNGNLKARGTLADFKGTLIDCTVDAVCGYIKLSGSQFEEDAYFEDTGYATGTGDGGNVFNGNVTIKHTGSGTYFHLATTNGDVFNGNLTLINTSTHEIHVGRNDTTYFNGNIEVNNTSTGGITFGNNGGISYLASGKTLSVGSTGFTNDILLLKNFRQTGSTAQTLTLTGSATANLISCIFDGALTITAPLFLIKDNTFNGATTLTKTGSSNGHSDGGNTFNGYPNTIANTGTAGRIRLSTTTADTYNENISFESTGQAIQVAYTGESVFKANITINNSNIVFNAGTGTVKLAGPYSGSSNPTVSNNQELNGTTEYQFKNLKIDKDAGYVTANKPLSIDNVLTLTKGHLKTDTTNLLTMKAGSSVSGASNNSFISGPVKKIGNTAFDFPVGKGDFFRPLSISSPSNVNSAFLAEYYWMQELGLETDTSIGRVSPCNYWMFKRLVGSDLVNLTLTWDSEYCATFDTSEIRLARWTDSLWVDAGTGVITGNELAGSLTVNSISAFGSFTLASSTALVCCAPNCDYNWVDEDIVNLGLSDLSMNPSQTLSINGTLTINADFVLQGGHIFMGDDARIEIQSGFTLTLKNTILEPCNNYQWDFIKIDGDQARLFVNLTQLIGADTAIWSHDGGIYNIGKGTLINRCWKGIMVDDYSNAHSGSIAASWIGCTTGPGTQFPALCYPPHATQRSFKGIDIKNVNSITIGSSISSGQDNNFFNLQYGIYSENSSPEVRNCNFSAISNGGYGIFTTGPLTNTINIGGATSLSCNFNSGTNGIHINNTDATNILYNNFELINNCVSILNSNDATINVSRNSMRKLDDGINIRLSKRAEITNSFNNIVEFKQRAIYLYNCYFSEVEMFENTLNRAPVTYALYPVNLSYYGRAGIRITNAIPNQMDILVDNNWITNTRYGIDVTNIINGNEDVTRVVNNFIYISPTYTNINQTLGRHYGIRFTNCNRSEININDISRDNNSTNSVFDGDEWDYIFGIQGNSLQSSRISTNDLTNISSGINLRDVSTVTRMVCNDFVECYRGMDIGWVDDPLNPAPPANISATISTQGLSAYRNTWAADVNNDAYKYRVTGIASNGVTWAYLINTPSEFADNYLSQNMNKLPVSLSTGLCVEEQLHPTIEDRADLFSGIVLDTLNYDTYELVRKYFSNENAYRCFSYDTTLVYAGEHDDSLYITYYENTKNTNIDKFYQLQLYLKQGDYQGAIQFLELIEPENIIEESRVSAYSIYLNTIAVGDSLSAEDIDILNALADQCFLEYGDAVYLASAMLEKDTLVSCIEESERFSAYNIKETKDRFASIWPNPSHMYTTLIYSGFDQLNYSLFDIAGRKLISRNIVGNEGSFQIDLTRFKSGIYFINLFNGIDLISSEKLVKY